MAFVDALVTTWRAGLFHHSLQSLLEAGLDERIKMTVEHLLRVGNFDARAQILDPRLIEHVRADLVAPLDVALGIFDRSEEHTSELQSLMRISYAVFCLKKKKPNNHQLYVHHTPLTI